MTIEKLIEEIKYCFKPVLPVDVREILTEKITFANLEKLDSFTFKVSLETKYKLSHNDILGNEDFTNHYRILDNMGNGCFIIRAYKDGIIFPKYFLREPSMGVLTKYRL